MAFINPSEQGIGYSVLPEDQVQPKLCKYLASEKELIQTKTYQKFVETEDGLLIALESSCQDGFIDCEFLCTGRNVVDSGSFTLLNTCSMPITITGFTMSDPERFSLFNYPLYSGLEIYESGTVNELPFTIEPRKQKRVETFFHPKIDELKFGDAGTADQRTGDKFGSVVEIYPGFKLSNCEDADNCDASVTLSGEFICHFVDREWMKNKDNFEKPEPLPAKFDPIEGAPDPNQGIALCPTFEGEHTKVLTFTSAQGEEASATLSFRANQDGRWETKIEISQVTNNLSNSIDWAIGHQKVSAGDSIAWIIVPDRTNNNTQFPMFFAEGTDSSDPQNPIKYYSIYTYDGSFLNITNSTSKPNGFIDLINGDVPSTTQPDCITLS